MDVGMDNKKTVRNVAEFVQSKAIKCREIGGSCKTRVFQSIKRYFLDMLLLRQIQICM